MSERARSLSWVVAGGGTGGHVTPALALAECIAERGDSVLFMGSERGLERKLVPQAGFELVALPAQQIMGRGALGRLAAVPGMLRSCAAAWRLLAERGTDVVVSVGGYASVPAVVAARLRRVPVALVEPNAIPGRANRAAARFAQRIYVQFEAAAAVFARSASRDRIREWGIPLRQQLLRAFAANAPRRTPEAPFRLLVFGGSQGAKQINETMMEVAARLDPSLLTVFHQTGAADRERVADAYAKAGIRAEVVDFSHDMPARYAWADLALCRSGALTVAELALAGLPALLVPYPYAADDHQTANARSLADVGAARVFDSQTFTADGLEQTLTELFEAPASLAAMSTAAAKLARPDAARRIIDDCAALPAGR